MNFGYKTSFKTIDKGFIEKFGSTGFSALVFNFAFNFTSFQAGYIFHTIFIFVSFFCLYFVIYFEAVFHFFSFNISFLLLVFGFLLFAFSKTSK
jgi:hypothetical protein